MAYKGINQDIVPQLLDLDQFVYSKNILLSDKFRSVVNEEGTLLRDSIEGTAIGVIPVEDSFIIFSSKDGTELTDSIIGVYHNGAYTVVQDIHNISYDLNFGFNTNYPITGVYHRNEKDELVLAWTDNFNPPRYLNIGTLENPIITDADTLNDTRLFPNTDVPEIFRVINPHGGSLESGAYYFAIAYVDNDGSATNYIQLSQPVYITDDSNVPYEKYDGAVAGSPTTKSVTLDLFNVDTRFESIRLAVVSRINQVLAARQIADYPIDQPITYTGSEQSTIITVDEVLLPPITYDTVKTVTTIDGQLYLGNTTTGDVLDYQSLANQITVSYRTNLIDVLDVEEKEDARRGLAHGEVYALYIRWVKPDGGRSLAYHIPGREVANVYFHELASSFAVTEDTNIEDINVPQASLDEEETHFPTESFFKLRDTTDNPNASTNMGVWYNEEVYPDGFGLTGPVRHHRLPSINHCKRFHYSANNDYGRNQLDRLGIDVNNVTIPTGYSSYEILYAQRSYGNSTVLDQSFQHFAASGDGALHPDVHSARTSSGNFATGGGSDPNGMFILNRDVLRWTGFNTVKDKPAIKPAFIRNELHLRKAPHIGIPIPYTDGIAPEPIWPERYTLLDFTDDLLAVDVENVDDWLLTSAVTDSFYIPHNVRVSKSIGDYVTIENTAGDECLLLEADYSRFPTPVANFLNVEEIFNLNEQVHSHLCTLMTVPNSIYAPFTEQSLVVMDGLHSGTSSIIADGDSFLCDYSMTTTAPYNLEEGISNINSDAWADIRRGNKTVHRLLVESASNINLRHETTNQSRYLPKSRTGNPDFNLAWLFNNDYLLEYNIKENREIGYNIDYSSLLNLQSNIIFDPNNNFINAFPYRIHRSSANTEEIAGWRNFKALNTYEQPKNKGEITNLEAYGDKLIIHHKHSLYITRDKSKLETDSIDITLGTGDIFQFPPQELIPETGYAGTINQQGARVTKVGYIFPDAIRGKVFILNDQLNEISNSGLRAFFRDHLALNYTESTLEDIVVPVTSCDGVRTIPISIGDYDLIPQIHPSITSVSNDYDKYVITTVAGDETELTISSSFRTENSMEDDNPFINKGYSVAYDEKYNRIILSKAFSGSVCTRTDEVVTDPGQPFIEPSCVHPISGDPIDCNDPIVQPPQVNVSPIGISAAGGNEIQTRDLTLPDGNGVIILDYDALSVVDKAEIIVDNIIVKSTSMIGQHDAPFDPELGIPTSAYANDPANHWYIGDSKGPIPDNMAAWFATDWESNNNPSGAPLNIPLTAGLQQRIFWEFNSADFGSDVQLKFTGTAGTAWTAQAYMISVTTTALGNLDPVEVDPGQPAIDPTTEIQCTNVTNIQLIDQIRGIYDEDDKCFIKTLEEKDYVIELDLTNNPVYKEIVKEGNIEDIENPQVLLLNCNGGVTDPIDVPDYPLILQHRSYDKPLDITINGQSPNYEISWDYLIDTERTLIGNNVMESNNFLFIPEPEFSETRLYYDYVSELNNIISPNNRIINTVNTKALTNLQNGFDPAVELSNNNITDFIIGDYIIADTFDSTVLLCNNDISDVNIITLINDIDSKGVTVTSNKIINVSNNESPIVSSAVKTAADNLLATRNIQVVVSYSENAFELEDSSGFLLLEDSTDCESNFIELETAS